MSAYSVGERSRPSGMAFFVPLQSFSSPRSGGGLVDDENTRTEGTSTFSSNKYEVMRLIRVA